MESIVIALGGNALEDGALPSAENQLQIIKKAVINIVDLIEEGYSIIVTHGNGPQIGRIVIQNELASSKVPAMPFDVCGAMSEGLIGYHLQQALGCELLNRRIKKPVVSLITQVVVDKYDTAFSNPTKPIGPFYSKEEKEKLEIEQNYIIKEDSNRGYRRVVASPKPVEIVELLSIKSLVEKDNLVICCGGGGIPVIKNSDNTLKGVAAVIDKDLASAKLANDINANILIILTAVPEVYINFGEYNQTALKRVKVAQATVYIKEGYFAAGSMLPKVEAAVNFVKEGSNRKAIITSLEKAKEALSNSSIGTTFVNK